MATMNISLPDSLKDWIERHAEKNHFSNVSDFMRDLVRKEKDNDEYIKWLNAEIDKGLKSGFREMSIDDAFKEAGLRAKATLNAKKVT
jgi:antitoxin ParD1/3/4